jgi:hypothetical protein
MMPSTLMRMTSMAFALLMADCSPPAAASIDPCSLLTAEHVSAAMGVAMAAGVSPVPEGCFWEESGKKTGKHVSLRIGTPKLFASGKTPLPGTEKPAVAGVGDAAYYSYFVPPRYDKLKIVDIHLRKGEVILAIEVRGLPLEEAKAKVRTLALDALKRL